MYGDLPLNQSQSRESKYWKFNFSKKYSKYSDINQSFIYFNNNWWTFSKKF